MTLSSNKLKIVSDDKIPFLKGVLEPYADVLYLPGSKTTSKEVVDASAIITRTRTKCNEALLANSSVKFIGTATIGFDHIDTTWVERNGIEWTNSPGCNSGSVKQYMAAALSLLMAEKGMSLKDKTFGVVGVGNVGSKVAQVAEAFGMKVLLCDPPRMRREGAGFVPFEKIVSDCDFISFHTPLNRDGEDKTLHLFNHTTIDKLKHGVTVFNTSRGEVIETGALLTAINTGVVANAVIDVWENEPNISLDLLSKVFVATPHIAGYSLDGKALGTAMVVCALAVKFGWPLADWFPDTIPSPEKPTFTVDGKGLTDEQVLSAAVLHTYPLRRDDQTLRQSVATFEDQRGNYPVRREFQAYTIKANDLSDNALAMLTFLGFNIG